MTKLITTLVIALFALVSFAQTESKTTSSYSISINTDDDDDGYNTSVSIKNSDDVLRLKARFNKHKTHKVKEILLKRLGKDDLKINGNTYQWSNGNDDDEFECKLSDGNLFIIVDKQVVANHFFKEINTLVNDLRYVISGHDSKKEAKKDKDRAKRDLERAQRDLERAERDLERAKRDLERAKKN